MKASCLRFTLLLSIALAVALWPSVFGGKVLLPLDLLSHNPPHTPPAGAGPVHNPLIGDMLYENFMWKLFQRRAIAAGNLPLWNPYSFCGHPLYTTGQASTFYPLNTIFWIMPPARAYVVFIGLHLLLGGLFTYLLFRRLGMDDFGATLGGFVFAMGGFFICRLVFPMLLASAIWLPLMLIWLQGESQKAKSQKPKEPPRSFWLSAFRYSAFSLLWGAPLFAVPILGGFFEIAFYAYFACGLFALVQSVRLAVQDSIASAIRYLGASAAVVLLAAVIAAPQILPFLEVMDRSVRAGEGSYETALESALRASELLPAVIPDALGNPTVHHALHLGEREVRPIDEGRGYRYFGPKNYVEIGSYLGMLPLLFALLSLPALRRQSGWTLFYFLLLLVLALCLAMVTPLYKLFFYVVPGWDQVRTPFRWLYLACFAVTYLAAVGGQSWHQALSCHSSRVSRIGVGLTAGLALALCAAMLVSYVFAAPLETLARAILQASPLARSTFPTADELAGHLWLNGMRLSVFLAGATVLLGLGVWRVWSRRQAAALALTVIAFVAVDLGEASFPFNTHADPAVLERAPALVQELQRDDDLFRVARYGPEKHLYANLPTLYGLEDYGGYDSIILRDYAAFLNGIEPQHLLRYNIVMTLERPGSLDSPLLPLLNIRYLLTERQIDHADWQEVPVDGKVRLYRVRPERELPRAYLVDRVHPAGSQAEAIELLRSGLMDVRKEAVVVAPADRAAALAVLGSTPGTAEVTDYRPSSVTIQTRAEAAALLVLADVHYPGWKAYVDGEPRELFVTNGVFRGVSVPAGRHTVRFRFEPLPFRVGVAASLVCLGGLGVFAVAGWRMRRREQGVAQRQARPGSAPAAPLDSH